MHEHKGHKFEVCFCNPNSQWGVASGLFRVESSISVDGFFPTYAEAMQKATAAIDDFVENVPQTRGEWIEAIGACMVWTGYEDCHLDETMLWSLLLKAGDHIKAAKYEESEGAE